MLRQHIVTAILVTYNRSDVVSKAIDCVQKQKYAVTNIVIVDNASTDNTLQVLSERRNSDSRITILSRRDNGGYAAGLDAGMRWALSSTNTEYFWMMDDDSFLEPETLELLLDTMDDDTFDMLGLTGFVMKLGSKKAVEMDESVQPADYILIDSALVTREVVRQVGFPNPDFFMMCEDYEYCLRIRKAGYAIGVVRNDHVDRQHLGSQRFSKDTLWRGYYHARNHMLILRDYFSWALMLHYFIVQMKYLSGAVQAPDRWMRIKLRLTGIYHGILSIKGKTLDPLNLTFKT